MTTTASSARTIIDITVGEGAAAEPFNGTPAFSPVCSGRGLRPRRTGCRLLTIRHPGNFGGAYRDDDVDLESSSEQGFNVGWIDSGEWMHYTVNIAVAGTYRLETRVASAANGGTFRVELDGVDLTGDVTAPPTGGWQDWVTVSSTLELDAGVRTLRFVADQSFGGFNVNALRFVLEDCLVDTNANGMLGPDDVHLAVVLIGAGDPTLDLDNNGSLDFFDVVEFLRLFDIGCG
jgi:hypothetical protein